MNYFTNFDNRNSAVQDFYRARNKAMIKEIIARFTGESTKLLSFDEVRSHLKIQGLSERGLKDVRIDAIVGSLGRYNDFTRDFLPRKNSVKERWTNVKLAALGLIGLPPVELYQIGEVYFVKDGNHRVSVARQIGAKYIQAYVTEVKTRVPLKPDDDPNDIILKSENANFLDKTKLDTLRPGSNLRLTIAGQYPTLEEHISVHRYFMGIDHRRPISVEEAVIDWYDTVYMPVIITIRNLDILRYFPVRTEADFYIWIAEHKAALEKELGWELRTEKVIRFWVIKQNHSLMRLIQNIFQKILRKFSFNIINTSPKFEFQQNVVENVKNENRLFKDILVPVGDDTNAWYAFEQALTIAKREASNLYGLYVITDETSHEQAEVATHIQSEFNKKCINAGVKGNLVIENGQIAEVICDRARYTDLVISNIAHPPDSNILNRLESGFNEMIQKCSRPIMAVPQSISSLSRGLLAYDGSPKSRVALCIATYLAGQWDMSIVVLNIGENKSQVKKLLSESERYFQSFGLEVTLINKLSNVDTSIIDTCEESDCNVIIMGGYSHPPFIEFVLGSVVNQVLQKTKVPVLICQ